MMDGMLPCQATEYRMENKEQRPASSVCERDRSPARSQSDEWVTES